MRNTLYVRDPFREFDALVRRSFGPATFTAPAEPTGFVPAAETHRDGDDAVIRLELPGVEVANDVSVEVTGRRLVVSGERRSSTEDGRGLREIRYGTFRRTFRLGGHVTADDVTASYDAGVLSVRVRGAYAEHAGQRIAISTSEPVAAAATESATVEVAPSEEASTEA